MTNAKAITAVAGLVAGAVVLAWPAQAAAQCYYNYASPVYVAPAPVVVTPVPVTPTPGYYAYHAPRYYSRSYVGYHGGYHRGYHRGYHKRYYHSGHYSRHYYRPHRSRSVSFSFGYRH